MLTMWNEKKKIEVTLYICKNIHTYINIACLYIKYLCTLPFFFFFLVHRKSQFFVPMWSATRISQHQLEGLLKTQILGFHPRPTELEALESQSKDFCLPTHPCPPTYYLVHWCATLTYTNAYHHWGRSGCSQGGRIMSNHLLFGIL